MRHWHTFPRAVDIPSLALFKARLDRALGNPVCQEVSLPMARGVELDGL